MTERDGLRARTGRHRLPDADVVRAWLPPVVLAVVVALASLPFFGGRYPMLLDFVVGPAWDPFRPLLYGLRAPVYGGRLPLFGAISVLPPDLAAKVLLPGGLALAAAIGYYTLPGSRWARCVGTLVLVVNPFVYARVVSGQWAVVWGLAALPLVLVTVASYIERPDPRRLAAAVGAITLLSVGVHLLYASTLLLAALVVARYLTVRDLAVLVRAVIVAAVALAVNVFWLVPALFARGDIATITTADLVAFAPDTGSLPPLFATASMHGFWREGYVYARDIVPGIEFVFLVVLCLAVYGALSGWRGERGYVVRALVVTSVLALLLGTGVAGPLSSAYVWLTETVPLFGGMRDANKFVGLLVVAYAYLGALGVDAVREDVAGWDLPDALAARRLPVPSLGEPTARRVLAVAVVGLLVLAPLVYTFPMVTGYADQVAVDDYPAAYHEVQDLGADADGDVLFLPWHGYLDLPWLDASHQRVRVPARTVFTASVVQGDTLEVGPVYSRSTNPVSGAVESALGLDPASRPSPVADLADRLASANVRYVVLARTADWRAYEQHLREHDGIALERANDHLQVYRVTPEVSPAYAFDGDPAGDLAPADSEPVATSEHSPVSATVNGTAREHVAIARTQLAAGPGWEYDGADPVGWRGGRPVFAADEGSAQLRFAPFDRVYLPSYAVSVAAVALLGGYVVLARRNGRLRPCGRLQGLQAGRDDD